MANYDRDCGCEENPDTKFGAVPLAEAFWVLCIRIR